MSRAIITLTKEELPVMDLFPLETEHFYQMVNYSLDCYKVSMACMKRMIRTPITAVIAIGDQSAHGLASAW